jgi:hypothetical protein
VRRPRSGPAAEQNIKPDAQVDQRNQPQPIVERTLGRNQNYAGIQGDRVPQERICRLRPDAIPVELALQSGGVLHILAIHRNQLIARLNATSGTGTVRIDSIGRKPAILFHPPNPIIGHSGFQLRLEVEPGKHHRSHRQQEQDNGNKSNLAFAVHGVRRRPRTFEGLDGRGTYVPPIMDEQVRCQVESDLEIAK